MFEYKNLVVDTSVLIDNPQSIHTFKNTNIFLTFEVLEELDKHKIRKDEVGRAARYINRYLDKLRKEGSLIKGVENENNSIIYVVDGEGELLNSFKEDSYDNRIISLANKLKESLEDLIVLSNDIAFRIKCDALGIEAASYFSNESKLDLDGKFDGVTQIDLFGSELEDFFANKYIVLPEEDFITNECVILRSKESSALAIAEDHETLRALKYSNKRGFAVEGIRPRSAEQRFAFEMLLDPDISLLTLTGKAGSGKTLMAIASAMHNIHNGLYDKVIISRPVESTSKDIGYLPGDKFEKMLPWIQPIFDNLEAIYGNQGKMYIEEMMRKGVLEVEALTYIRGRSLPNTIFIIDEAQNINYKEAKALITRMGEDSKLVLIGDIEQIDSVKLNEVTSGLSNTIEVFKSFESAAHITLRKGERSRLATFAAENM